ncbi:hypothetical protein [Herbaspirillum sp. ST 5-3]|uniref:hypothetical protein n=1 Tax=Herbaspirillum sp. ST 5-3 TaxID=2567936 RepID=UPI0010A312C0|nr:hypothetical protein [Herbaspirillum sp. ST 5-3]
MPAGFPRRRHPEGSISRSPVAHILSNVAHRCINFSQPVRLRACLFPSLTTGMFVALMQMEIAVITTPSREDAVLGNFIRLLFGQPKQKQVNELFPQDQQTYVRHGLHVDGHGLPEVSATCWRRLVLGETEITTADISLRFLLKNNVRYVKRASNSEDAIAERIRITRNFFIKNRLLLNAEVLMLSQIEGEKA